MFFQHHLPSSPITSHPQSETGTQQSKRLTVEDLGPDDSEDEINHQNSPVESPFKVPLVSDNYPEPSTFHLFGNSTCLKRNTVELILKPSNLESEMNATRSEVQTSEEDGTFVDRITSPANLSDVTSDSMSSSVFSDSSAASHSRNRLRKYTKQKIDHARMAKCKVETVNEIPWDIDGDHIYEVPADAENYMRKYRDGRWFVLKAGSRLGLNGYRKVGTCQGSLICTYDDCTKLTTEGVQNTYDFKRVGAHKLLSAVHVAILLRGRIVVASKSLNMTAIDEHSDMSIRDTYLSFKTKCSGTQAGTRFTSYPYVRVYESEKVYAGLFLPHV